MKTEKLTLSKIKNALSRSEMKKITAGSGGPGICGGNPCGGGTGCLPFCVCVTIEGDPSGTCMGG